MDTLFHLFFFACWLTGVVSWFIGVRAFIMTFKHTEREACQDIFINPLYFLDPRNLKLEPGETIPFLLWRKRTTRAIYIFVSAILLGLASAFINGFLQK